MEEYKYYIEVNVKDDIGYGIIQSVWFHTEKDAIDWANKIFYLDRNYEVWLMCSEWNYEDDEYIDIKPVRKLNL